MLSNKLGNILEKRAAGAAALSKGVKGLAGTLGLATPFGMDWVMQGHAPFTTKDSDGSVHVDPIGYFKEFDALRSANMVANAAMGALIPITYKKHGFEAASKILLGIPTKDVMIAGVPAVRNIAKALETWNDKTRKEIAEGADGKTVNVNNQGTSDLVDAIKSYKGILGVLGAGALGIGAASLIHKMRKKDKEQQKNKGRIKYIIPGKKGDPTTYAEVDVPIDSEALSQTMRDNISSNIRRQALKNIKANQRKRDPETGKLISNMDYETKYNVDVDGDGEIGNPFDKKPTDPSDSINRYMYKK